MFGREQEEIDFAPKAPLTSLPSSQNRAVAALSFQSVAHVGQISQEKRIEKFISGADKKDSLNIQIDESHTCPTLPANGLLSSSHFSCSQASFSALRSMMDKTLSTLDSFDFSFSPSESMWRGKYIECSKFMEIVVRCYWDAKNNDHVVEFVRMAGDCMQPNFFDIVEKVKSAIVGDSVPPAPKRRGLGMPLPVPSNITNEQFLSGLNTIHTMQTSDYRETRLESTKMICELTRKDKRYLELIDCRNKVLEMLSELLSDEFEDIQEFAVMALYKYCDLSSYLENISQSEGMIHQLCCILLQSNLINENENIFAYKFAQFRRKTSEILVKIASKNPKLLKEILISLDFHNKILYENFCLQILDKKTQNFAMKLLNLFQENLTISQSNEVLVA